MTNKSNRILSTQSNKIWVIYIIIFFIILTPNISIKGLPSFRLEQIIVILFAIYIFVKVMLGKKIQKINMTFPLLYLFFSYLIILSTLIGSFTGLKVIINDFFEIYKVLVNIGIYLITLSVVKSKQDKIIILKFMTLCLLISVLISVQQYFNLFNINEKYVHIIAPTQYRTLINNYPYPRVIGGMT